jgi:hypothetical protein
MFDEPVLRGCFMWKGSEGEEDVDDNNDDA